MPRLDFFRNLGIFVQPDFLQTDQCAWIYAEMCRAPQEQGGIFRDARDTLIDTNIRSVHRAKVNAPAKHFLTKKLEALRPSLEEHFTISLEASSFPEFLIYNLGGLFVRHIDVGRNNESRHRRVSVVIFLSRESEEPAEGCYGGGKLTFHGILKEPGWTNCAFSINSEPGLLIAFPSDLAHEVTPVTFGRRLTVVSWFLAKGARTSSETGGKLLNDVSSMCSIDLSNGMECQFAVNDYDHRKRA